VTAEVHVAPCVQIGDPPVAPRLPQRDHAIMRRDFIAILAGAAALCPLAARAQENKIPRVGILTPASSADEPMMRVLRDSFHTLGYIEGKDIILDFAFADGDLGRIPALAAGLVRSRVDVIVTDGGNAVNAIARAATATIPIVVGTCTNPVEFGFAASLSHPGGNLTGFVLTLAETNGKRLEILKSAFPTVESIAVLWNKAIGTYSVEPVDLAGPVVKVRVRRFPVDGPGDLARGFAAAATSGADGMITIPDAVFFNHRSEIVALVAAGRLPTIYPEREYVEAGGLMSYGTVVADNFRRVPLYVDRILKGANPGDLPIQEPTKYELVVNLRTAKALGLTIPSLFLARADEVIE
jgi:putative ABC transport system substrate-binding protein